jgi:plastocyanin
MKPQNKDGKRAAMGMIPATALVLITLIATIGAVEITISAVSPSGQSNSLTTSAPGGVGSGANSIQPSEVVSRITILAGSSLNVSSSGFSPNVIVVIYGQNNTVTWTNADSVPHTITSDSMGFNSGNLSKGQSFTYTFNQFGTFIYQCTYYPWMHGTVMVENPFAA